VIRSWWFGIGVSTSLRGVVEVEVRSAMEMVSLLGFARIFARSVHTGNRAELTELPGI
jgi:hypothetical protein